MKRAPSLFLLAALALLALTPLGCGDAPAPVQSLILEGGETTNLREYDPATTHGSGDKRVFSGLVSLDPGLNLIPDLASTWQVSPDGSTYTFTLRDNARFHSGRPVTSQDVIYSFERAAAPETQSETVMNYLGDILGVRQMHAGQAAHVSGLRAIDDHHLEIKIDAPKPYFLLKLTYPTAFILDQANIESGPDWVHHPNGTGPYKLIEWQSNQQIVYQADPDFYLGPPPIPYVLIKLYSGDPLDLYETGDVDMTGVYTNAVDRFLDPSEPMHAELRTGVSLCTIYIQFDNTRPPFDDAKVRQAFSLAFDRQKYIDVVLSGHALPAVGPYPPGLPGYNAGLKGLPFDPAQARQLLADSKYHDAAGLPPITYTSGGFGSSIDGSIAAMAQMWKQYLDVDIHIENIEPNFYYDQLYSGNHGQLFSGGWCADYPDPENFADVLYHTGSDQNTGGYSNPDLDRLLEGARVEQDVAKRITMYEQAEQMIVNDAPVIFTTHPLSYMLVKPYVKGFVLTPVDISLERYMWLEGR